MEAGKQERLPIVPLLILAVCIVMWSKDVYRLQSFDYTTMEERILQNREKGISLYFAAVAVSERETPVAENYPYQYDIYAFHQGDQWVQKPFILASINDTLAGCVLCIGGFDLC